MQKAPIRIILVDDHDLARQSWKLLLQTNPDFELVSDCGNGKAAIEEALLHEPDVMLVDINMSPINGFDVTEAVMKQSPFIKIIGLSVHNQAGYARRIFELGAKGYLTKTSPLEEITHCINIVSQGENYVCQEVRRNMPLDHQETNPAPKVV
jgi:two-component system invasion response regulator UvrY